MEPIQYFLKNSKSLQMGHFKLASGRHSNLYAQCAQVLADPDIAVSLGSMLASKFKHLRIDLVVSPAMGGIIIGQTTAQFLSRLHLFMEKVDGEFTLRRGFNINSGANVLIIEDVWTTAGSAMKVHDTITKNYNGNVVAMGAIVNRMGISGQEWPKDIVTSVVREALIDLSNEDIISKLPAEFGSPFQVEPDSCPLCERGIEITTPGSRENGRS